MNLFGKALMILGVMFILFGLYFALGGKLPWLGRLPGDIYIQKKGFTVIFPIATSILISVILSLLASFFMKR